MRISRIELFKSGVNQTYILSSKYGGTDLMLLFNPLTTNVPLHLETSLLICNANQLTGFYMMGYIGG